MKRTSLLLILLCGLLAAGCQRRTVIPDNELALIFHDAFLANAYTAPNFHEMDSLRIYEPIFARYGYTAEDVVYTVGNFSKRKSARLGDVVEQAIALLEKEGKALDREVAAIDTVDNVALRTTARIVYAEPQLRIQSLRDTLRGRLTFDVEPGQYDLRMRYTVDSTDRNRQGIQVRMWLEDSLGNRSPFKATMLSRNGTESTASLRATADSAHRRLQVRLLHFLRTPQQPSIRYSDITLKHTLPRDEAVRRLYRQQLDIRIFADEFFRTALQKDSL